MKHKKDHLKLLDERYKSSVDNGIWETRVKLFEAFDPESESMVYPVLITHTFDDGVEEYEPKYGGEIFTSLDEARAYFNKETVGMYKNEADEFLSLFDCLKPKEQQIDAAWADLFN